MNCYPKVKVLGTSSSVLRRCLGRKISVSISTPQTGKNMLSIDIILCSNKFLPYIFVVTVSCQINDSKTNPNKTYNLKGLNKMAIIHPTHITYIKLNLKAGLKPQNSPSIRCLCMVRMLSLNDLVTLDFLSSSQT